ncbi:MAG: hypothetical protein KAR06_00365 [Deltaproteobacteria bacterium]|nr:hypothetical protein [Deltaproteobacteria bacterium]
MKIEEFRDLLKLDRTKLDHACQTQADLFYRVSQQYTMAVSRRDEAKEEVSMVDAKMGQKLRATALANDEKLTDKKMAADVQASSEHEEAHSNYLTIKAEADEWGILKESFLQRASMLKELCSLYIAGYFSDVVISGAAGSIVPTKQARERISEVRKERLKDQPEGEEKPKEPKERKRLKRS